MSDPSLALQGAVVAALKAKGVAGGRIHQDVPADPDFPYVTLGEGDSVGDDNACFDSSDVAVPIHVWSRAKGFQEAKSIAAAIRDALKTPFAFDDFNNPVAEYRSTRTFRDPDGKTKHAVVEFRYLIDHAYSEG